MSISWHATGYWVRTGTVLFPLEVVLLLMRALIGGEPIAVAAGVVWLVLVVIGVVCASFAILYYAGLLKITCPLCKRPAHVVSQGRYTFLRCDSCGEVHAKGFFRTRYEQRGRRGPE